MRDELHYRVIIASDGARSVATILARYPVVAAGGNPQEAVEELLGELRSMTRCCQLGLDKPRAEEALKEAANGSGPEGAD